MKRLLLIWALFLCSLTAAFAQFSGSGSGTKDDPYLIFYAEQLSQVRNFLNKEGVYFKLMLDIDLSDWISENAPKEGWQPIGTGSSPFLGVFDGNNHVISGLIINRPSSDNVGLFGMTGHWDGGETTAIIRNVKIEGSIKAKSSAGGFSGYANSTLFENCSSSMSIVSKGCSGGIVGTSNRGCSFNSCTFNGANISGTEYVGGIVGKQYDGSDNISLCSVNSTITGTNYVGGLVGGGEANSTSVNYIKKCKVNADIVGNNHIGGVIGDTKNTTIDSCFCSINIIATGDYVGGLIGSFNQGLESHIRYCSVTGHISAVNYTGGLIGFSSRDDNYHSLECYVENSFSICNISSSGDYVGGLVGYDYGGYARYLTCKDSYHSGTIQGRDYVGGIFGFKREGEIKNVVKTGNTIGRKFVGGIIGKGDGGSWGIGIISCFEANHKIVALEDNVGRIYGSLTHGYYGDNPENIVGQNGTKDGNIALSTSIVSRAGVTLDISDDEQNGFSMGESGMKLRANYVSKGWDFNNDWTIQETETYPYKPWQAAPPKITSNLVSQETTISGKSIDGGTVYIEVGDSYKSSVVCNGNQWSFSVPALQSGDPVRLYAVVDGKGQSPYTDATVNYPGSGTEADPYRVYTAADLQGVYKKGFYKLMNDIDLTEWINKYSPTEGWPAIGKNGVTAVYFDGAGHKITGLWCNTTAGYNGLFSNFPAGYIKNLTVETASGKSVKGGDYTAVLIGRMTNGKIENVTVKGNAEGSNHVGGITGMTSGMKFNNVNYEGETTSSSAKDIYIGGLAGLADGDVSVVSSYAKVKVTTTGANAYAGGIFGKGSNVILKNSHAETTAKTSGDSTFVGGLVGVTEATDSITKCYSEGTLSATGAKSYVGGLVGINKSEGLIENCYSISDATSTLYAAGLVAYNYGKVSNSYSKGNVNSEFYGAGVVGYNDGAKATVNNLVAGNPQVNVTDKSGWSIRVLGGFKNGAAQPGENNYALSTMILSVNGVPKKVTDNILDGYAKTEDELKSEATYEKLGWSFSRVWKIDEANGWPTLDMTVYGLVTSVILDQKTLTLKKGQTATLRATVKPDDATNKTVAWSSSDTSIATVKDGVVRGVGNGKATIIATSTDGTNLADSAIVTVYAPVNDTIVLKDTTTLKNKTIMYPVYLNNEDPVCSFQLDVYLPDGIDIAKNSKGKYDIQFAGRQEDTHSITSNKISTGAVRVIAFSIANDNFSGKSGALVNIPITIGDVAKGDYNISIRNIVLADASEKEYYCQDANGVIHVNDVIMGDANSDGKVSLADVNSTVNYIAEKPSGSFCFAAADMNNNGIINVSDVNAIVNVLAEVKMPASAKKNFLATANEVTTNDKMYCSNITVAPGKTATLPVNLENRGKYCSFQFDILLPKGITVDSTVNQNGKVRYSASLVTSRCVDHSLTSNLIRGNRYRVIVFSLSNTDVEGVNGPVVNIKLKAEEDAAEGDYTLKMERVVLATADEKEYYPADSESTVTVSANTGVNSISIDPSSVKVYDLQGRKVNKPTQGVYIVNGKKVVIK